jgi:hypothetical protein
MHKLSLVFALGLGAAVVTACGGGPAQKAQEATPPPAAQTAPAGGDEAPAAAAHEEKLIGVAECDDYIKAYLACVDDHVPAEARDQLRSALEQAKTGWQQAAAAAEASPEAKASLVSACTQARDAAKASLQAYGCEL